MSGRFYANLPCPYSFAKVEPALVSSLECTDVSFFGKSQHVETQRHSEVLYIQLFLESSPLLYLCVPPTKSNVSITPLGQGVNAVSLVSMETL